ncbi:MAG TPA: hypothetical protein VFC67_01075 [Prolixibacteraceae bacterium]|nr:hypothetical protein [Prolixibacteraceae bacterium]
MKHFIQLTIILCIISLFGAKANENRWKINEAGGISWLVTDQLPHHDHIEMSGKYISAVIRYGVETDKSFWISRDIVWPMLRTIPNNTHASLIRTFNLDPVKMISINKRLVQQEIVNEILLDGKITVKSTLNGTLDLVRTLFPSTDLPVFGEKYELLNIGNKPVTIEIPDLNILTRTKPEEGTEGSYTLQIQSKNNGAFVLQPKETVKFYLSFTGIKEGQDFRNTDIETELSKRNSLLSRFSENLVLETPDETLNRTFAFAKIRAAESIYQTKGGPMHGPGGLSYYAAIWANDQAEYINPFFPYLGYDYGIESALNAYRHFARFMNPDYKPIPSSIVAEGTDIWNGAGDRGDGAMIAYGAARFALSQGDRKTAEELWPLIEWCLEFNKRKVNPKGVVGSDSDELEGRFPSGKANLCTSSLYYDALNSAVYLGKSLGKNGKQLSEYKSQAVALKTNIEKYFGAKVMDFDTYQYYEGNDKLRAWICMPLTVNILDRKQATIDALFSPELWTEDGLACVSGDKTFWDRSTLYALRGVFAAGDIERGLKFLQYYSNRRLLGEHVPYPVEAFPEGNQRHLSAESGLYCRIFTEGLFGIRPVALNSFTITPQLPGTWNYMKFRKVHGYQKEYDIAVERQGEKIRLTVTCGNTVTFSKLIKNGTTQTIVF